MSTVTYFRPRTASVKGATQRLHAPANTDVAVRLRVDGELAPYFLCQRYHRTQRILAENPDGSVDVGYAVDRLEVVAEWVRLWGGGVRIVSPEALADLL